MERRFEPVRVPEPTVDQTVAILRGLRERYERHHGVRIRDAALDAAATLSVRYVRDRFLPDKAIDLVDRAARGLRLRAAGAERRPGGGSSSSPGPVTSRWTPRTTSAPRR